MEVQNGFVLIAVIVKLLVVTCVSFQFVLPVVSKEGFLSLDCGGDGGQNQTTKIVWEADFHYLKSEVERQAASVARVQDGKNSEKTVRVFIPSRTSPSKYCYILPANAASAQEGSQFLLRVVFPSRNLYSSTAEGNKSLSAEFATRFYFTVDSTYVATINLDSLKAQTIELIVSALDAYIYVCLVPLEDRSSLAAISSLELRPLAQRMYERLGVSSSEVTSGSNKETSYLMSVSRLNFGGNTTRLSYPLDPYDRIWTTPELPTKSQCNIARNATIMNGNRTLFLDKFPEVVTGSAWEGTTAQSKISFKVDLNAALAIRPFPTFYISLVFRNLDCGSRTVRIDLDGEYWYNYTIIDCKILLVYNQKQEFESKTPTYTISVLNGTLPPQISAYEIYGEFAAKSVRTAENDDPEIEEFAGMFEHLDTSGDPCLPVPWNWLVCSIETVPQITQINLTGTGVEIGQETKLGTMNFEPLSRLTILDLSNNNFSGQLPKSIGSVMTLSTLDLSKNKFSGSISGEIGWLINLKILDLSENSLDELKIELRNLSKLAELNLANNSLKGTVPEGVWISNAVDVDLSDNKFEELNLTSWINGILNTPGARGSFQKRVRLLNNPITKVYMHPDPPSEELQFVLTSSTDSFVLLGIHSQWCSKRKETNATFIVKHLCRASEFDPLDPLQGEKSMLSERTIIIICVVCGISGLMMITLFLLALWKIRRRQLELRQVQEELAKQDVWPPIFSYDELKAATKGFSQSCELGRGAFAAVYRAELADGTKVAVKKLFTATPDMKDFVKELVLITGIKHKHLVQLKGCCIREKKWMLVYEYAENKNLAEALWGFQKPFTLSWAQRVNICLGIARGLQYLLEDLDPKIIHRDIKPENILLDKDFNAKIADFGLARNADGEENAQMLTRHISGTLGYLPPEYATNNMVTDKLDVYSYGILALEIVAGRRCINLASTDNPEQIYLRDWAYLLYKKDMLLNVLDKELVGTCPDEEVLLVLKMALACIQGDWKKRPAMSQVVNTLMMNSDIAVDIVKQLKESPPSFDHLFEDNDYNHAVDHWKAPVDEQALLYTTSTSVGYRQSVIELQKMNVSAR